MSCLSMMEAKLPPGFRFHPRDDELICHYLVPKATDGNLCNFPMMIDVDLNKCEPWDLPETACVGGKEWYFFNLRDRKYATGQRTNRATLSGYWKATGKDRHVARKGLLIGMRKTLVFYQGRAPKGRKTDWVMHEFRIEGRGDHPNPKFSVKEDWVLCRVFSKSRSGHASKLASPSSDEDCYDDTCSSALPALTTFPVPNQIPLPIPQQNIPNAAEQVPCFSSFPQAILPNYQPQNQQYNVNVSAAEFRNNNNNNNIAFGYLEPFLDQLSKQEGKTDQASSDSYLTDAGLSSSMWYSF